MSSVFNPFMTGICPQELNVFRSKCGMLFHYDWISIPLVYTQVTSPRLHLYSAYIPLKGNGGLIIVAHVRTHSRHSGN